MPPPFDAGWRTLDLARVEAFLNAEREEGLTWEAKGGERPRPDQVRKAVSGFANAIGGSLILGAECDGEHWALPGMTFPGGEASTWLSNIIRELSPVPQFDVRVLATPIEGRLVAVVAVEQIDAPPCMAGGSVYQRVSGQTVQVLDQTLLRSLLVAGAAARERAADLARSAANAIYADPRPTPTGYGLVAGETAGPARVAFGLGLAPVAWPSECRGAVFTAGFGKMLRAVMAGTDERALARTTIEVSREWLQGTLPDYDGMWAVRVYAQGAVAVAYSSDRLREHLSAGDLMPDLRKAWTMASDLVRKAGADGEARLAVHLETTRFPPGGLWTVSPKPRIHLARSMSIGAPTEAELGSIHRELDREAGLAAWEPEA